MRLRSARSRFRALVSVAARRSARERFHWGAVAAALVASVVAGPRARAAQVQQITGFGTNPSGIGMYLYTPTNVAAKPAVLVGVHACHGKGTDVCANGTPFAAQADKWGFLLVCPSAVSADGCWDVHSNAVLSHGGGGDASGIIAMVDYLVKNENADAGRVYVAGHSSGGMMTNVLLGAYPDVFKAGAAFAGVAFGCFAQGAVDNLGWNAACAKGTITKTGAQWGDLVRAAHPTFSGPRPRVQLWHGTKDDVVDFKNFNEEIKEWTNVLAVSDTPFSTENNAVQTGWIRTRFGDGSGGVAVEAVQETNQPHNLVLNLAEAVRFFGLDGTSSAPDGGVPDGRVRDAGGGGGSGGAPVDAAAREAGAGGAAAGGAAAGGAAATGGRNGTGGNAANTGGVAGAPDASAGSDEGPTHDAAATGSTTGSTKGTLRDEAGSGCACHTTGSDLSPSGAVSAFFGLIALAASARSRRARVIDHSSASGRQR